MLTVVKRKFLKQWQEFGGGAGMDLEFLESEARQWCDGVFGVR